MIWRAWAIAVLIVAGAGTVQALQKWMNATFDKPPAPLQKELDQISRSLGTPIRYEATKPDVVLESEVVSTLGTTKYLVREYHDLTLKDEEPGSIINLNVNYYPSGSSTPHVPENCWVGNGREQVGPAEVFEVSGVQRLNGQVITLRANLVSFKPQATDGTGMNVESPSGKPLYSNVAYVFHVNGDYVATTSEVTSRFWKAQYKYAYHAKIEVTPMMLCTREAAKQVVGDFLRASLAEVEKCLPDPAILSGPVVHAGPADTKQGF